MATRSRRRLPPEAGSQGRAGEAGEGTDSAESMDDRVEPRGLVRLFYSNYESFAFVFGDGDDPAMRIPPL
jgi:hypothetical protein